MKTRKQATDFGLTFENTYLDTPFKDTNWQLIRVKGSKKAFLWVYEKDGFVNLNVVERFLEADLLIRNPRLPSEQGTLEYYNFRWKCT